MFWTHESSTVSSSLSAILKEKRMSEELGLSPVGVPIGSWSVGDTCGFQVAIEILRASQYPGKNAKLYTQFDSIQKIRTGYLNAYESGLVRCLNNTVFKSNKGQMFAMIRGGTQSKLFTMFMLGCKKRMGRVVRQDVRILFEMLREILRIYDEELNDKEVVRSKKRTVVIVASAFVILRAGALQGNKVFMVKVSELVKRRDDGRMLEENDLLWADLRMKPVKEIWLSYLQTLPKVV